MHGSERLGAADVTWQHVLGGGVWTMAFPCALSCGIDKAGQTKCPLEPKRVRYVLAEELMAW